MGIVQYLGIYDVCDVSSSKLFQDMLTLESHHYDDSFILHTDIN
jgi:hypothetical protein